MEANPTTLNEELLWKKKFSARVIAITSGKGGVGKTNVCTNLGIALSRLGRKVCIFDADVGLANINILTKIQPEFTLEHLLAGQKTMDEIIINGPAGIRIVPAASGVLDLAQLPLEKVGVILEALDEIERKFDYIFIDTSSGIADNVISFVMSASEVLLVITPEPTSLTDSYSLLKVLKRKGFSGRVYVLTNLVRSRKDSIAIFDRFNAGVEKYLNMSTTFLGCVVMDRGVVASVIEQTPIMMLKPDSAASLCFHSIAEKLESAYDMEGAGSFGEYWKQSAKIFPAVNANSENAGTQGVAMSSDDDTTGTALLGTASLEELAGQIIRRVEAGSFPEESVRELNLVLESIYEKRFKRSIRNLNDVFIKLLEDSSVSESRMKILSQALENSFRRRFNKPIYNLKSILADELSALEEVPGQMHQDLIYTIRELYKKRFGSRLKEPLPFSVEDVKSAISKMKEQEALLEDTVSRVLSLKKEREKLEGLLRKMTDS